MSKPRVFATRSFLPEGLEKLKAAVDLDLWPGDLPPSRQELLEHVRGVDGLLSLLTDKIDAEVMDAAGPSLKVISNHAVGFDNIDIPAATARRIPVGNTPGILTDATADFAFTLLLSAARRVVEADHYVRTGQWKTWGPAILLGADLSGSTLGLVGFGRIGQAVAKRAAGFNMRIVYYDPQQPPNPDLPAQPTDLNSLLSQSDFVSLHVPLNEITRHMMNDQAFDLMKPTAVLINTARGPIVDQDALYRALNERRIAAAALDVTDPEPLPMDSPLLSLDNLTIAPHIASASLETRRKMGLMAVENLLAGLNLQRLPNPVNPEVYQVQP
jgi:glyoxylate reductase